jgi:hypothetical protein
MRIWVLDPPPAQLSGDSVTALDVLSIHVWDGWTASGDRDHEASLRLDLRDEFVIRHSSRPADQEKM